MLKHQDKRKRRDDEVEEKHVHKLKQSFENRKMYRNIDNVLKKKSLQELKNLEYDDYR
jgi:cation transport regulator ChaB